MRHIASGSGDEALVKHEGTRDLVASAAEHVEHLEERLDIDPCALPSVHRGGYEYLSHESFPRSS